MKDVRGMMRGLGSWMGSLKGLLILIYLGVVHASHILAAPYTGFGCRIWGNYRYTTRERRPDKSRLSLFES